MGTFEVYGIYDTREPDRCRYVGLTERGIITRLQGHWKQAKHTPRKLPILLWMRKRTQDQVEIRVLEISEDSEHLKVLERFWIAQMREFGYADLNVTNGGESANGYIFTDEVKARMAEARKKNPPFKGMHHTDETKAILREKQKARYAADPSWASRHGEKMGKFRDSDIAGIRLRYDSGEETRVSRLAKDWNTSLSNMYRIVRRETWKHVL